MAEKTLRVKRSFVWAIYSNLKNMPPKEYPTTEEIKDTIQKILPALKEHVTEYAEMSKEATELAGKVSSKEMTEEESKNAIEEINKRWRPYNKEHGVEVVEVKMDSESFKTFSDQFNRKDWGTTWLANLEEFGELLEAFAEASK